jgi:hypothetical protein
MLFFQSLTQGYEHDSTILTSNKDIEDRAEISGDEVMAAALIDGLVHHCHTSISGGTVTGFDSIHVPHLNHQQSRFLVQNITKRYAVRLPDCALYNGTLYFKLCRLSRTVRFTTSQKTKWDA